MRPVNRKLFGPALPARVKEPLTGTKRTQRFAVRLRRVGATQREPTRRPRARRATVNRTEAARSSVKVTRVPLRAAATLPPRNAGRKRRGETLIADSSGLVPVGPLPPGPDP